MLISAFFFTYRAFHEMGSGKYSGEGKGDTGKRVQRGGKSVYKKEGKIGKMLPIYKLCGLFKIGNW